MNITVVGGGNVGTQIAVHCAEKGHRVTLFTSKPEKFSKKLSIIDECDRLLHEGEIYLASADETAAFSTADAVFVTMPAYCMSDLAARMLAHLPAHASVGLVPGTGGGECAFAPHLSRGGTVFGLQRVPSVARLVAYGKTVRATGYRERLHVAALPACKAEQIAEMVGEIFDMPCTPLPNYLNVTLTPSNPILHTTRLRSIFADYTAGKSYARVPLFYEEWSDESSELLLACDAEVQALCAQMPFALSFVKSLREHYESDSAEALTKKIRSIKGFKGLPTPSVAVEGGFAPDLDSRYFVADFSFGLSILVQIAAFYGTDVPHMKQTLAWYEGISRHKAEYSFADFGITDKNSFEKFYQQ